MNIGQAIKLCRKNKRLTQSDLAKRANLSVSYISLLEKNKRDPNISVLTALSNAMNLPTTIIIILASENNDLPELGNKLITGLKDLALELIRNAE